MVKLRQATKPEITAKRVTAQFVYLFSSDAVRIHLGTAPKSYYGTENPAVYSGIMLAAFLCK